MPIYHVDGDQYYHGHLQDSRFVRKVQICEPAINNLMDRYGLRGKSILSLGAGEGHEEYSFLRAGCRLTMNDVNPGFEGYLQRLEPVAADHPGGLSFSNEDAADYLRHGGTEFDLLYVSSFHPDEVRREQITGEFVEVCKREGTYNGVTWPKGTPPYLPVLMDAFSAVRPGGLIVFQHYRGCPEVTVNSHYLLDIRSQFAAHGVTLLEVYCFRRAPTILLVVAFKGDETAGRRFAQGLQGKPEIHSFHGRYEDESIKTDVVKVLDLLRPELRPETAFSKRFW